MRDPDRLDDFYARLKELHKTYVPDWRFGQLMDNLFVYAGNNFGIDLFFAEEDRFMKIIEEYFEKIRARNLTF